MKNIVLLFCFVSLISCGSTSSKKGIGDNQGITDEQLEQLYAEEAADTTIVKSSIMLEQEEISKGANPEELRRNRIIESIRHKYPNAKMYCINKKMVPLSIGMSSGDAQLVCEGIERKNKTTNAQGVSEQWCFCDAYLYFENGRLTTIQTRE